MEEKDFFIDVSLYGATEEDIQKLKKEITTFIVELAGAQFGRWLEIKK